MRRAAVVSRALLLVVAACLAYSPPALAYIDPNLGLLAIQGVIAAFGAVLITARKVRSAVRRLFDRLLGRAAPKRPDDDA